MECDDPLYQYMGCGTAFICCFENEAYLVCARHTWEKMGITLENFRIFLPGFGYALLFDYEALFGIGEMGDLKVMRVDRKRMSENQPPSMFGFDMNAFNSRTPDWPPKGMFMGVGYPQCRRAFHYDVKRYAAGIAVFSGYITGELEPGVLTMKTDFCHIDDADGLSGSPVFYVSGTGFEFAGVVVRAGTDAGIVHFIHGQCVMEAIKLLANSR